MAKVEKKVGVVEVILTMTEREAEVLMDVLGRVSQHSTDSDEVQNVYDALHAILKENKE